MKKKNRNLKNLKLVVPLKLLMKKLRKKQIFGVTNIRFSIRNIKN